MQKIKPVRRHITIVLNNDDTRETVPAVVFGSLAAWEDLDGWNITHVPTGCNISPRSRGLTQKQAKRLVRRLLRLNVDWRSTRAVKKARERIVRECAAVWGS